MLNFALGYNNSPKMSACFIQIDSIDNVVALDYYCTGVEETACNSLSRVPSDLDAWVGVR